MHVVIDANIFIRANFGNSKQMELLLSESNMSTYEVCVPRLVIDEVVGAYSRMLEKQIQEANASLAKLAKSLSKGLDSPLKQLDLEKEIARFRETLKRTWIRNRVITLNYPNTSHESLTRRAISRRRPFNAKGSGYRDALIWDTVVKLAAKTDDQIILLSGDSDFCDPNGLLHPDLVDNLKERGLPDDSIALSRSLAEFIDKYIRPTLELSLPGDLPLKFIQIDAEGRESLAKSVSEHFSGVEWSSYELGLSPEFETLHLNIVEAISDLEVEYAQMMPDKRLIVALRGNLDCGFDVFIYKPDWYLIDDDRVSIYDSDWNDHYVLAEMALQLQGELKVQVDVTDPEQHIFKLMNVQLKG